MWGPNLVAREPPQGAGKGDTAKARAHTVFVQFPFPEGLCLGNVLWVRRRRRAAWGMAVVLSISLLLPSICLLGKNC